MTGEVTFSADILDTLTIFPFDFIKRDAAKYAGACKFELIISSKTFKTFSYSKLENLPIPFFRIVDEDINLTKYVYRIYDYFLSYSLLTSALTIRCLLPFSSYCLNLLSFL